MSSWTFETFEDGKNFAEYRWNKGNTFEVFVGHKVDDIWFTDFNGFYATKEQAKKSFKRQVAKLLNNK